MPDPTPAPATFDLSPDGRKLTIHQPTTPGRKIVSTNTWDFDPTPELIYKAIAGTAAIGDILLPDEKMKMRRLGPLIVTLDTGPPTWYWPHVKIELGRDWSIGLGWFRAALTCSRTHSPRR